ncbi:Arylsulfatase A [Singulisphaera sp. GP187]|uniref:sulfatase family protein n=1 Tax=Singulisphaera sp. GP187 TaxID=1882752 RepID=UPI00092B2F47|nr:sulfatase [Singulisphaera sp. GP187]SIO58211.1 Arylsulfatase A [Singulisphaera sp. GP187]
MRRSLLALRAISFSCLMLGLSPVPEAARAAEPAPGRPNFLFVFTDDQRYDAMSVVQREQGDRARFPWFQTPHMDRLASEGVRFRNAFVVNSLCAPSRACMLTGRYSHHNGIADNQTPFPTDSVTYASLLRAAGYTTGYVGKWHMDGQKGKRPGFDESVSFIGQGKYVDCPFEVNGKLTPTTGWVDDRSTDFAVEFLKKNQAKPFALVVGFKSTHGPFDPPDRAHDRFAGETPRPAANQGVRPIYRATAEPAAAKKKQGAPRPGEKLGYFRCVSAADDNLGRLMTTLDELGLAEDTVLVFTSDNGYYLGEHSLGDKRSAYDESLRVPLLVRYPRLVKKGKLVDSMVLNIDVASTFLDLAGVPVPKAMQGRSWRPLLEGKPDAWRTAWFYEYFQERAFPGTPTILAVRTENAKLITYPGHPDWTELFDLKADPYEKSNLASDPAHQDLRQKMEAEFASQQKAVGYTYPSYADFPQP